MKGKIKFYNRHKDFGFITALDGKEFYFNAASFNMPTEGAEVEFATQQSARGEVAKDVVFAKTAEGKSCPAKSRSHCVIWGVVSVVLMVAAFVVGHYV